MMSTPLCILLVDDSPFFLELEKRFLANTPATVFATNSGDKALDLAREHRPSLIYLDMEMPAMDGVDCCRAFKADAELCGIPLILVGQQESPGDEASARAAGADAYLAKPLDRREFLGQGHHFLVSIDRREPRRNCRIAVEFLCRGRRQQGHCIDISSGGMFLDCQPQASAGESVVLWFVLPDARDERVELHARINWANNREQMIKQDYPLGYGLEFVDIDEATGAALRRCFGV